MPGKHELARKRVLTGSIERLTPREREVLALVTRGLANKEIGHLLDPPISDETVQGPPETHLVEAERS